jgi:hypothetical protein
MDESAESYDLRKANNNVIRWPEHREFFASQNGDRWFVGRHKTTMNGYIIHKANESSGGACTEMEVEAFLRRTPPGVPEYDALLHLIGTFVERLPN